MAEFPAMPVWTDAYIGDTQHLTNEEHGVYWRLLIFAWRTPNCCLPCDDGRLAIMVGVTPGKWAKLKPVVMAFWSDDDGFWRQKGQMKVRRAVMEISERNRRASEARWRGKSLKSMNGHDADGYADGYAKTMPNTMRGASQPKPKPKPKIEEEDLEAQAPAKSPDAGVRSALENTASTAAITSFMAYRRKSKGRALTVTGAKRLATHLRAIFDRGGDTDDALAMAEERGWQTVEPDWYFNAKGNGNGITGGNGSSGMAGKARAGGYGQGGSIASAVARRWADRAD